MHVIMSINQSINQNLFSEQSQNYSVYSVC